VPPLSSVVRIKSVVSEKKTECTEFTMITEKFLQFVSNEKQNNTEISANVAY
jgi:hypothetical protein